MKVKTALNQKRKTIIGFILILLSLFTTCFIFYNSIKTAESSTIQSETVRNLVEESIEKITDSKPNISSNVIRKFAHYIEFFVLGLFITASVSIFSKNLIKNSVLPIFICLIIALIDETLQLAFDGRSGQLSDVWLDFSASFTSILIFAVIFYIYNHNKNKTERQ